MSGDLVKKDKAEVDKVEPIELMAVSEMGQLVHEILAEVEETRKEALEVYTIFRDLLANEGEGSAATKEQIATLLQVALEAEDKKLKVLDMCLKAQKQMAASAAKGVNNTQNNYFNMGSRREMIKAIESVIDIDSGEVKVMDDEKQD